MSVLDGLMTGNSKFGLVRESQLFLSGKVLPCEAEEKSGCCTPSLGRCLYTAHASHLGSKRLGFHG